MGRGLLRVTSTGKGYGATVELDGQDIGNRVASLDISMNADGSREARLRIFVDVDFEGEVDVAPSFVAIPRGSKDLWRDHRQDMADALRKAADELEAEPVIA